jgi:hypothetical protein
VSQLHSGTWIGIAVNQINGNSEKFVLEIKVNEDGSFAGTIQTQDSDRTKQLSSTDVEGRYSPYGTLHLRYTVEANRHALFDGKFEAPDDRSGVMYGSLSLVNDGVAVPAFASMHFTKALTSARNGHVWGK